MRPRITEQSYRPRVSDRTMRYRLFKADNRHLLVSFRRPNGVVTTRTWNDSGEEKKVSRLQRKTTLSRIECARSKQVGLNDETKKGVGIEPTGEIFLLTFTLIGLAVASTPVTPARRQVLRSSTKLLRASFSQVSIRPENISASIPRSPDSLPQLSKSSESSRMRSTSLSGKRLTPRRSSQLHRSRKMMKRKISRSAQPRRQRP